MRMKILIKIKILLIKLTYNHLKLNSLKYLFIKIVKAV